jgi:hypothetical protein
VLYQAEPLPDGADKKAHTNKKETQLRAYSLIGIQIIASLYAPIARVNTVTFSRYTGVALHANSQGELLIVRRFG